MNQSGIKSITLYDPLDTTYELVSDTEVTNITGTTKEIINCERPNLQNNLRKLNRGLFNSYSFLFTLFGLDQSNAEAFRYTLGWFVKVSFLDGAVYWIPSPHRWQETELDTNNTNHYSMDLTPDRQTIKPFKVV